MKPHRSSHFFVHLLQLLALLILLFATVSLAQTSSPESASSSPFAPAYDAITIAQPTDGSTVFNNEGNIVVQILLTPVASLRPGERVLVNFDGAVLENAGPGNFTLRGVERGEHWLQAAIVDANGYQVRISNLVRFDLWLASPPVPGKQ